jgi:hypothetical protein
LEYHIFHYPIRALLKGTNNGGSLKIAVGQQILSTSFDHVVNHAAEDKLEEDVLQQVMATTLEEQLSPPCLDDVADYFNLAEEEVEFLDSEQEINPETPPIELKQLPPGPEYVFLNGDRETLVIISDKLSNEETQKLVVPLEKYQLVIGYSLKDLKGISPSLCTHRISMDQDNKPIWDISEG